MIAMRQRLDLIEEDHMIQRILCRDLENLADRLPEMPPLPELRRLCDRIRLIAGHYERAEATLQQAGADQRSLCRVTAMHRLDEIHAEDLIVALWNFVETRVDVGQLSYMLRCYFDGCRRAIALKESMLAAVPAIAAVGPQINPD